MKLFDESCGCESEVSRRAQVHNNPLESFEEAGEVAEAIFGVNFFQRHIGGRQTIPACQFDNRFRFERALQVQVKFSFG
jgi:hypothetical protein